MPFFYRFPNDILTLCRRSGFLILAAMRKTQEKIYRRRKESHEDREANLLVPWLASLE